MARGQNLEHLQKAVFLCWSFLEVYIFATTYRKAFIVGPKVPYPNTPHPTPPLPTHPDPYRYLAYPTLLPLPYPNPYPFTPTPYPTPPHPSQPYPTPPYPTLLYPTQPYPYHLRIQTHAHNQASSSRATLSCDSSYKYFSQ